MKYGFHFLGYVLVEQDHPSFAAFNEMDEWTEFYDFRNRFWAMGGYLRINLQEMAASLLRDEVARGRS
jgi:hypothetical protein